MERFRVATRSQYVTYFQDFHKCFNWKTFQYFLQDFIASRIQPPWCFIVRSFCYTPVVRHDNIMLLILSCL